VYVPVAANCCTVPSGRLGAAGVTATDAMTAEVTVSVAVAFFGPTVAVIVVWPVLKVEAVPVLAIVATVVLELDQVAASVRSRVDLSEYVPVTTKACVKPLGTLLEAGVMSRDTSCPNPTVRLA
jgi:hypothetical protein